MEQWELILTILGSLWALFKSSTWYANRREQRITRVFEALEVGVVIAWERIVKPYLEKNGGGGKLPPEIRREAEHVAIAAAKSADKIIGTVPRDILRATLKMAVEEAKRRGGK
jgi:hypothetical protein